MGWSTLALSTLSSASISLEKAMSSGTPASAISVVGDARTSRARDAGMITRCLSRGTNFERSAGRVCGGSSASIDGGRLQLFRKLAQLKAFFRAMIVTVCSMKKFSGYSLFKMMTRQFGLERTIEPVEPVEPGSRKVFLDIFQKSCKTRKVRSVGLVDLFPHTTARGNGVRPTRPGARPG